MNIPLVINNKTTGQLRLKDIYLYYDGPVLFTATGTGNQTFLVVWADRTNGLDVWLLCPLSADRLANLECGHVDLFDAFNEPETGRLVHITVRGEQATSEYRSPNEICRDLLPDRGTFLPKLLSDSATARVLEIASEKQRVYARTAFSFADSEGCSAPLRPLAKFLGSIQDCIDAFNQSIQGHPTPRGAISAHDLTQSKLLAVGSFDGSFGIELVAAESPPLWGDQPISNAVRLFQELLEVSNSPSKLREKVKPLGVRSITKYRAFLQNLHVARAELRIEWASPDGKMSGVGQIRLQHISPALEILTECVQDEAEAIEVRGTLVAINTTTRYFDFRDKADRRFAGKVVEDSLLKSQAAVNREYVAKLLEICEVDSTTGEERIRYELLSLDPPN